MPTQGDLFSSCQRWREGRANYRPAGEPFNPTHCEVRPLTFGEARSFTLQHHYSRTMPSARMQLGLFHKPSTFFAEELAGVIVLSVPMQEAVIPSYFGGLNPRLGIEIGRLVLLDHMKANSESWFLGQTVRQLKTTLPEVEGLISYCDPVERRNAAGELTKASHRGTIYRAFNGKLLGRSAARTLVLSADGRCVSERAMSKIRNHESGEGYATRQLIEMGAPSRGLNESGPDYLERAMRSGAFTRLRHPGNLAFAWWLGHKKANPLIAA